MNDSIQIKILLISVLFPIVYFALHILLARICIKTSRQLVAIYSIVFPQILWPFLIHSSLTNNLEITLSDRIVTFIYVMILELSFGYIYFHFFNTSETARRIHILHEIREKSSISEAAIIQSLQSEDIIGIRLLRLTNLGQLTYDGHSYFLKGRLLYIAALFVYSLRTILNIRKNPPH